ncbi:MAG: hypothetical protein MJE68_27665, partial [Proteobacteria bacterium]|nr:hypothetical protein [Pseudomonadota bacterium]
MSQPLLESQQSTATAADYAMSQPLLESQLESQQSTATAANDREDADTIDYKSPASTPPPQPSVDPLFPLVDGHVNPGKVTSCFYKS